MMPAKAKSFDFETYVVQALESMQKKLDGLNTQYVPREEIMLMRSESVKTLANLTETVSNHTVMLAELKSTDDRQQGKIDSQRLWTNAIIGLSAATASIVIYLLTR